jgi:hypothetical protein
MLTHDNLPIHSLSPPPSHLGPTDLAQSCQKLNIFPKYVWLICTHSAKSADAVGDTVNNQ